MTQEGSSDRALLVALTQVLEDANDLTVVPDPGRVLPAVQLAGGCAGVASWALGDLYRAGCDALPALHATAAVLVACPEHLTAWNIRKRALDSATCGEAELAFSALVLRRAPKCAEAWAHRKWALARINTQPKLRGELELARHLAAKTFANYHAGVHRMQMIHSAINDDMVSLARLELAESRNFLCTHPTDPSAWAAHRAIVDAADLHKDEQQDESLFVTDMSKRYVSSQAVKTHVKWWTHRIDRSEHPWRQTCSRNM